MDKNILRLNNIQKIIEILDIVCNKINPGTDVTWTGFASPQELIKHIKNHIKLLRDEDYEMLGNLSMMFAPTGPYQELSISNGWDEEFLHLSKQFDYYLEKFRCK